MYIDTSILRRNGKTYTRYLLRDSYREHGKVKHHTIANLSHCSPKEIAALKFAMTHKNNLAAVTTAAKKPDVQVTQGLSVGALWLLKALAKACGLEKALGPTRAGKLALWQVFARVLIQGSRLSAVRLASQHAVCDILNLDTFHEADLYQNLDWLCRQQQKIEERLFKQLPQENTHLFLYDVTSSYFEGTENELAAFGYNRDGKRGKSQIVVGLLCNAQGIPITVEVFEGNTQDPKTLTAQLEKTTARFGIKQVTWIGDRGMVKSAQARQIIAQGAHYITAITKTQIRTLLKQDKIQLDLFDTDLVQILDTEENVRYILRRNPVRAEEIKTTRASKWQKLLALVVQKNEYLQTHSKAKLETALTMIRKKAARLKIENLIFITHENNVIALSWDELEKQKAEELDGCYVLKTDLTADDISKETVHARYKDLAMVESAFRTSKTTCLELRPIYLRNAQRTKAHVFVVMLAYRLVKELKERWHALEVTVAEGLRILSGITHTTVTINHIPFQQVPTPDAMGQALLKAADVTLPTFLHTKGVIVATRKKLVSERKL